MLSISKYMCRIFKVFFFDNFFFFFVLQYVKQVFTSCANLLRKKQFCYMIARHVSP